MESTKVYIALGSNIGDSFSYLKEALIKLEKMPTAKILKVSGFYRTTPVSDVPQDLYINAVCQMTVEMPPLELLERLKQIEKDLGRVKTVKDGPRTIDLDILFYGKAYVDLENLKIPHPRWKERLFVVKPLSDLIDVLEVPTANENKTELFDIKKYLENFPNIHQETVIPI